MSKVNINSNVNVSSRALGNTTYDNNNRIEQIMQYPIMGTALLPKTIGYEDIDAAVLEYIKNILNITYDGQIIPTYLFSIERFSEFTESWQFLDDNKNIQPPIKILTRTINVQKGSMLGDDHHNIPTNTLYDIGKVEKWDGKQKSIVLYQMKQPYCVDFDFNLKFISSKLFLVNNFNNMVIQQFRNRQVYVQPNGYFMPMTLEGVDDESVYGLDERKYYVQNFNFKLMGYIINESDLVVTEVPTRKLLNIEVDKGNPTLTPIINNSNMIIDFPRYSKNMVFFRSRETYDVSSIQTENISDYTIFINGEKIITNQFVINPYDKIVININRTIGNQPSKFILLFS